MYKSEDELQQKCVLWFKKEYPDQEKCLFEINNKTNRGNYRKSLGLQKGASDLCYIDTSGDIHFFELKIPESRHKVDHLADQLEWLDSIPNEKNNCSFIFYLDIFQKCISLINKGNINDIQTYNKYCLESRKYINDIIVGSKTETKTVKLNFKSKIL